MEDSAAVSNKVQIKWPMVFGTAALMTLIGAGLLSAPFFVGGPRSAPKPISLRAQAAQDFERVRSGFKPACQPSPDYGFSDGGTLVYECDRYQLTVRKSLTTQGGVDGYLYGPVLTFESGQSVSDVRFYTKQELSDLFANKDGL